MCNCYYGKRDITMHSHIGGSIQKRRNSSANALELRLFCIRPSLWFPMFCVIDAVCHIEAMSEQVESSVWFGIMYMQTNAGRSRYNTIRFLQNPHNKHPIAHPWVWGVFCEFRVRPLVITFVSVVMYAISCYIRPRYIGTQLSHYGCFMHKLSLMLTHCPLVMYQCV